MCPFNHVIMSTWSWASNHPDRSKSTRHQWRRETNSDLLEAIDFRVMVLYFGDSWHASYFGFICKLGFYISILSIINHAGWNMFETDSVLTIFTEIPWNTPCWWHKLRRQKTTTISWGFIHDPVDYVDRTVFYRCFCLLLTFEKLGSSWWENVIFELELLTQSSVPWGCETCPSGTLR